MIQLRRRHGKRVTCTITATADANSPRPAPAPLARLAICHRRMPSSIPSIKLLAICHRRTSYYIPFIKLHAILNHRTPSTSTLTLILTLIRVRRHSP